MKPLIIANWKMNPANSKQAFDLAQKITKGVKGVNAKVVLCPPLVFIPQLLATKNVEIGAQNCSWEQQGALTGEVSPTQLKSLGCTYAILGHSERKKYVGETLSMTQAKVTTALKIELKVLLCVENIRELQAIYKSTKSFKNVVVVYEPSFAISTQGGKRESPVDIAKMVEKIRKVIGKNVPVLYGGSVDAKSIAGIMAKGDVQGALVGAASLKAQEFIKLVKNSV